MASWPHMNTGVKISGAAHLGLILWMAFGGLFSFERDAPLEVSDVTLISGEQFGLGGARSVRGFPRLKSAGSPIAA